MQLMFYLNMWWSEMPFVQKNLNAPKNSIGVSKMTFLQFEKKII